MCFLSGEYPRSRFSSVTKGIVVAKKMSRKVSRRRGQTGLHSQRWCPNEGAPRHAPAPLRRKSDTVLGEDPLDSVASEFMS